MNCYTMHHFICLLSLFQQFSVHTKLILEIIFESTEHYRIFGDSQNILWTLFFSPQAFYLIKTSFFAAKTDATSNIGSFASFFHNCNRNWRETTGGHHLFFTLSWSSSLSSVQYPPLSRWEGLMLCAKVPHWTQPSGLHRARPDTTSLNTCIHLPLVPLGRAGGRRAARNNELKEAGDGCCCCCHF